MAEEQEQKSRWQAWQAWGEENPVWFAVAIALGVLLVSAVVFPTIAYCFGITGRNLRDIVWAIGSLPAAVLAVLAAYLANRRTNEMARQNDIANDNVKQALRQNEVAEKSQITDSYTRAIEQLGNDESAAVRMGGLYVLEQLLKEAQTDDEEIKIVNVITGFIRNRVPLKLKPQAEEKQSQLRTKDDYEPPKERSRLIDVEAAVKILAGFPVDKRIRTESGKQFSAVDLRRCDLRNIELLGCDLSQFNFDGSFLQNLNNTILVGVNFIRANLTDANLHGSNLTGSNLGGTNFTNADLGVANLSRLFFANSNLTKANLNSATLNGVDFTGGVAISPMIDRPSIPPNEMGPATLTGAIFYHAKLNSTNFGSTDLTGTRFESAFISHTLFHSAKGLTQYMIDSAVYKKNQRPQGIPRECLKEGQRRERDFGVSGICMFLPYNKRVEPGKQDDKKITTTTPC